MLRGTPTSCTTILGYENLPRMSRAGAQQKPLSALQGGEGGARRAAAGGCEVGGCADRLGPPHPALSPRPAGGEDKSSVRLLKLQKGKSDEACSNSRSYFHPAPVHDGFCRDLGRCRQDRRSQ